MLCRLLLFVVLAAAVIVGGQFIRQALAGDDRPNVLIITIDTLRADRVGCYGNQRIRTPNLDGLAQRGVLFERAFSAIPATLPSHATIMTGLYPHQHGVRDNGVYRLSPQYQTLAERFRAAGYATAGFVSAFVLDHQFRINQGFETYDDEMEAPMGTGKPLEIADQLPEFSKRWMATWNQPFQRPAGATVDRAVAWLNKASPRKPFFLWVHLFDPHLPYQPPDRWAQTYDPDYAGLVDGSIESFAEHALAANGRFIPREVNHMIACYDGEVSFADEQIGRLLAALDARGWTDDTLIVFVADHGEAFGEHQIYWEHIQAIFAENVHVPMVFAGPGVEPAGVRRSDLVGTIDVAPTVLKLAGLPMDDALPGRSLIGEDTKPRSTINDALYFETLSGKCAVPTPVGFRGLRTPNWTLLLQVRKPNTVEAALLFETDGGLVESKNVYSAKSPICRKLVAKLDSMQQLATEDEEDPESFWPMEPDSDRTDPLKSLGYAQ